LHVPNNAGPREISLAPHLKIESSMSPFPFPLPPPSTVASRFLVVPVSPNHVTTSSTTAGPYHRLRLGCEKEQRREVKAMSFCVLDHFPRVANSAYMFGKIIASSPRCISASRPCDCGPFSPFLPFPIFCLNTPRENSRGPWLSYPFSDMSPIPPHPFRTEPERSDSPGFPAPSVSSQIL